MLRIVDCTLRDGGYYTNWDYDAQLVEQYLGSMARSRVDVVEAGYISPQDKEYRGRYYYLSSEHCRYIRSRLNKQQKVAVMINLSDWEIDALQAKLSNYIDAVDIIRLAVVEQDVEKANKLAMRIADLGYQVVINLMYLSKYLNRIDAVLASIRSSAFTGVTLVDSYGSCFPADVKLAVSIAKRAVGLPIGFHGHNNLELAFANALVAMDAGVDSLDATITGMGRGAGNLRTELIISYLEKTEPRNRDAANIAGCVDLFEAIKRGFGWGASLPYMISGLNDLPQKKVMEWLGKSRYSSSAVIAALTTSFLPSDADVYPGLPIDKRFNACMIIGGGRSVSRHLDAIKTFVEVVEMPLVHASLRNYRKEIKNHHTYVCITGADLEKYSTYSLDSVSCVVQPPPRIAGMLTNRALSSKIYQVESLENQTDACLGSIPDVSPLALALATARDFGVSRIYIVGFDGYENATLAQQSLMNETALLFDRFRTSFPSVEMVSLTPSLYALRADSIYRYISDYYSSGYSKTF